MKNDVKKHYALFFIEFNFIKNIYIFLYICVIRVLSIVSTVFREI